QPAFRGSRSAAPALEHRVAGTPDLPPSLCAAALPYFNPHRFRHTLAIEGQRRCRTIEELKAWSQNLGHEGVLTPLTSYGQIPIARQAELINRVGRSGDASGEAVEVLHKIQNLINRASPSATPLVDAVPSAI